MRRLDLPGISCGFTGTGVFSALEGSTLFVAGRQAVLAVDLPSLSVKWARAEPQPPSAAYRSSHRSTVAGRNLWCHESTVCLLHEVTEGVELLALDTATGAIRWRTVLPTPPPAEWTVPGLRTEDMRAGLVRAGEVLAVALVRISNTHVRLGETPPPARFQLDVTRIDPNGGGVMWAASDDQSTMGLLSMAEYTGLHSKASGLLRIDWETGSFATIWRGPGELAFPVVRGAEALVAFRRRGGAGCALVEVDGGAWTVDWQVAGVTELRGWWAGPQVFVQTKSGMLTRADREGARWTARAPQWIYGVAATDDRVYVGSTGAGGGLYCFAAETGAPIGDPVKDWSWQPVVCGPRVVSPSKSGLVWADRTADRFWVDRLEGFQAQSILGVWEGHPVVLASTGGDASALLIPASA